MRRFAAADKKITKMLRNLVDSHGGAAYTRVPRAAQPSPLCGGLGRALWSLPGRCRLTISGPGRKPGDHGLFDIVDHGRDAQAAVREIYALHLRIKLTLRLCKVLGMAGRKSGFNLRV